MRRLRLLVLLTGIGALVAGAPVSIAAPPPGPEPTTATQARALDLLHDAAVAARTRTWSGTEYLGSWHAGTQTSAVVEISHTPATGSVVRLDAAGTRTGAWMAIPTYVLDERLLALLADRFELRVAGPGRSAGRAAHIVEARRPGASGAGAVAGRFWVDAASALVLRREVYDEAGRQVRSSAFVDLSVLPASSAGTPIAGTPTAGTPAAGPPYLPVPTALVPGGQRLAVADLDGMRQHGWPAPVALPGQFGLYEARMHGQVLQLAYSDGLSTLSVFVQRGAPAGDAVQGFVRERVGRSTVWAQHASPERMVWAGAGHTWTLLSDAPTAAVRAAVVALPHDRMRARHAGLLGDGLVHRLCRGLTRLGSWLNPFH